MPYTRMTSALARLPSVPSTQFTTSNGALAKARSRGAVKQRRQNSPRRNNTSSTWRAKSLSNTVHSSKNTTWRARRASQAICALYTQKSGNSNGREACWHSRCRRSPRSTRAWRCKVVERLSERGPICDVDSSGCLAYHLAWCTRCWHAWALPQRYASYLRSEECYGRYSDRPGPGDPKSGHRG